MAAKRNHELPRHGAAQVSLAQFGLPLARLDPPGVLPPPTRPARIAPARPIHVSAFQA
jgi:hypothetical protein